MFISSKEMESVKGYGKTFRLLCMWLPPFATRLLLNSTNQSFKAFNKGNGLELI